MILFIKYLFFKCFPFEAPFHLLAWYGNDKISSGSATGCFKEVVKNRGPPQCLVIEAKETLGAMILLMNFGAGKTDDNNILLFNI